MKVFFKELFNDMLKQAVAAIIWSSLAAVGNGVYSYATAEIREDHLDKHCTEDSMFHYHPVRMAVCKLLEMTQVSSPSNTNP